MESVKEKTQDVVENLGSLSPFKDKLQKKENLSGNDLVQSIRKQTESEDIVLELDEKDSEEATEEENERAKTRLSEPHFRLKDKFILETFLKVSTDVVNFKEVP